MKISVLLTGLAIIIVMSILYFNVKKQPMDVGGAVATSTMATNTTPTNATEVPPAGKIKADTFTGILQSVNTGCFSDGECYIIVDGKHVTILMGRSQQEVGTIISAPSIGDLENYIGKSVEVYARDNSDGTYSLYGSTGFHVKVLAATASSSIPNTVVATTTKGTAACVIGGCSSQLCVDADSGDTISTCIYRTEYACYKTAKCERQTTGQCGWTETPALTACIAKANSVENNPSNKPQ